MAGLDRAGLTEGLDPADPGYRGAVWGRLVDHLKSEPAPTSESEQPPRFTREQLRDPAVYRAHREEILAEVRAGRVR